MTRTSRAARRLGALTTVTMASGLFAAGIASAGPSSAAWTNDTYSVCSASCLFDGGASGGVIWGNRTSTVQGSVSSYFGNPTTVHFDAFAGSTKVDSETRTTSSAGLSYNFTIGNPDLPGGVDRIRVQVCTTHADGARACGDQFNMIRD